MNVRGVTWIPIMWIDSKRGRNFFPMYKYFIYYILRTTSIYPLHAPFMYVLYT